MSPSLQVPSLFRKTFALFLDFNSIKVNGIINFQVAMKNLQTVKSFQPFDYLTEIIMDVNNIRSLILKNLNENVPDLILVHQLSSFLVVEDLLEQIPIVCILHDDTMRKFNSDFESKRSGVK